MKNHKNKQERFPHLKRKLMAALCMLLISSILMATTSYAWLVLSIAPEVTGMSVNVGANGALEIALLNKETHGDLSKISSMGGSLANRDPKANNAWGNTLDLSYEDYGLQELVLWPSRLNLSEQAEGYVISGGVLSVPTYGYDGRIIELTDDTVTGTYDGKNFSSVLGEQDYGVRVVGTADTLSAQSAALAMAKSNIKTYMNSANQAAASVMNNNGGALIGIMMDRNSTYDDEDLAVLKTMIAELQTSLDYIDLALRQGMVAVAASKVANEDTFETVKKMIQDETKSLSTIWDELTKTYEVAGSYKTWIDQFEMTQGNLDAAKNACTKLEGGSYTWEQFKQPLNYIMNMNGVYINEDKFEDFDTSNVEELLAKGVIITLAPGSGVFADIADFAGDFSSWVTYMVKIEIKTMTTQKPVYLQALSDAVSELKAADGSVAGGTQVNLTSVFGYVVDMAFRTNAAVSDLLLQTTPAQRVSGDSDEPRTQGSGSYMEFTTDDETFTIDKMLELMDAIRVAFVDDQGNVLGIAKLNTSNREVNNKKVKAPLYLYTYHIDEEDGSLQLVDRQKENNVLTALEQNVAKAVSAVVWLDGDLVDNTKVSATQETSLKGTLNLQFASSADLISANNNALLDISADKTELKEKVTEAKAVVTAGQGTYTTESWKAFMAAYDYAVSVNDNAGASELQVYMAARELTATKEALAEVSHDALLAKIAEIRELVGKTEDVAYLVNENGDTITGSVTQEAYDAATKIYRADYSKNLLDNGNDLKTPIYTDESWTALTAALYQAELTNLRKNATDAELDASITAMQTAYEALERNVYFIPYDYEGVIYYLAVSPEGDTDTYGKWYDNTFARITSDLQTLKLDAQAEQIALGKIVQDYYISTTSGKVTPYVDILDEVYPELKEMAIKGIMWNVPEQFDQASTIDQRNSLQELRDWAATVAKPEAPEPETTNPEGTETASEEPEETTDDYEELLQFYTRAQGLMFSADLVLAKGEAATYAEAEELIVSLLALQTDYEVFHMTEEELAAKENVAMSADQYTLLLKAINAAKGVEGYNDPTKTELDELRAAVAAAVKLLNLPADNENTTTPEGDESTDPTEGVETTAPTTGGDTTTPAVVDDTTDSTDTTAGGEPTAPEVEATLPTEADAIKALEALNAQLEMNGVPKVTASNTLAFQVPVTSDTYEVIYVVDNPMTTLVVDGGVGETEISAVVLTANGVVFKVTKAVEIYSPAGGAQINGPEMAPQGGMLDEVPAIPAWTTTTVWNQEIDAGNAFELKALLEERKIPVLDDYGNHKYVEHKNPDDETQVELEYLYQTIAYTEIIKDYTWASSNPDVLKIVLGEKIDTCLVNAVAPGTATITVTIETEQGNFYATDFEVTVREVEINGYSEEMDINSTATLSAKLPYTFENESIRVEYKWTTTGKVEIDGNANGATCTIKTAERGTGTISLEVNYYKVETVTVITPDETTGEDVETTEEQKSLICKFTNEASITVSLKKAEGAALSTTAETMEVGESITLTVALTPDGSEYEGIESCAWTADTDGIVTLVNNWDGTCTVTGVAAGKLNISVTVTTERGQTFVKDMVITVTDPAAEPTEPTTPSEPATEPTEPDTEPTEPTT